MYDNCVTESVKPVGVKTIASLSQRTSENLKEANLILDRLFDNVFGPRQEKRVDTPHNQIECLESNAAMNAEQSYELINRLNELNARLFG